MSHHLLPLILLLAACSSAPLRTLDDAGTSHPPADLATAPRDLTQPSPPDLTPPPADLAEIPLVPPPPYPTYSKGMCPQLLSGPTADTSINTAFPTGDQKRNFRLLVPKSYDGTKPYALLFAWHWLNASSGSFVRDGELETAAEQMHMIVVLPDQKEDANGKKAYQFSWPFVETWDAPKELTFFDDLLACVDGQYHIDHRRVFGVGVSAGALWLTYLSTTDHVKYLAAVESLSGGLGEEPLVFKMEYKPQPNKFAALVLWGGPNDWLGLSFEQASKRYRDDLIKDHHFVVTCTHDAGHAMPPVPEPMDGTTRFKGLWEFMLDHPYGLPPGTSPYQKTGLPADMPPWCKIATP